MVIEEFVDTELLSKNMKHGKDGDMKVEFSTVWQKERKWEDCSLRKFFFLFYSNPPPVSSISNLKGTEKEK